MANLNPTFRRELRGKKIIVEYNDSFTLTRYELNQIRFWLYVNSFPIYNTPTILPVSKRFCLDFKEWEDGKVYLMKFKKVYFRL